MSYNNTTYRVGFFQPDADYHRSREYKDIDRALRAGKSQSVERPETIVYVRNQSGFAIATFSAGQVVA